MTKTVDEIQDSFSDSPFFSFFGFEIVHFEEGNVILKLPIEEELLNVNGTVHGGVHATMLDTIMGMVIRSVTKTRCTTINMNVSYLSPSYSGEMFAKARILKQGYRIVSAEGELFDNKGNLLAKSNGSFKLVRELKE